MQLEPKYTASVTLTATAGGGIAIDTLTDGVSVALAPFFRGSPGPAGTGIIAGPGFKLIGDELRHDIISLTRV